MQPQPIERLIQRLNPEQRDAVLHGEGPLLVLAGAGTGKTRVVTVRIARLLADGIPAKSILAVTFTNKAAREMKERVTGIVGKKAARPLTISTFHSFAVRLLRAEGEAIGLSPRFTIADDEDRLLLVRSAMRDMGISEKMLPPRKALWIISEFKNEGKSPSEALESAVDEEQDLSARAYEVLARDMLKCHVVDFDDMILLMLRLLRDHPDVADRVRDRYHHLLVDEYQDTNGSQYEVLRRLSGGRRNLCVVGDDDQSIYGWRGARSGNIVQFPRHYPGAKVVTLVRNYRSTEKILACANALIRNNVARAEKELRAMTGVGDDVVVYEAEDEREEILHVCTALMRRQREGAKWDDMAVLFRANTQAAPFEAAFRERKIPYRLLGTRSIFDRRECRDLLAFIKVAVNPRDDGALLRILNTPPRGIGKGTRDALLERAAVLRRPLLETLRSGDLGDGFAARGAEALVAFGRQLALFEEALREGALAPALGDLVHRIDYLSYIDADAKDGMEAQARRGAVEDVLGLAARFDERHGGEDVASAFLESLALDAQDRDEDEGFGVSLMTVHAAKGLEFDHVFIVGAEEGLFPHRNSLEGDDGLDTIDEERRLFYVAITRAKKTLEITRAMHRRRWGRDEERERSRFLEEIGEFVAWDNALAQGPADENATQSFLDRLKGLIGEEP